MTFYDLDLDCQLLILDGLPLEDKFKLRLVSKEWKPLLELALKGLKVVSNRKTSYSNVPYRGKDAFEPPITSTDVLMTLVTKYCPNLTKLAMVHLVFDSKSLQQLGAFLFNSTRLSTVALSYCQINLQGLNDGEWNVI